RVACVVAQGNAQMIRVAERIARIPGNSAIQEAIVRPLAVRREIRGCCRVIERPNEAAELRAPASRSEAPAFAERAELRHARRSPVREHLNDAGDRVRSVNGAFRAPHYFHL